MDEEERAKRVASYVIGQETAEMSIEEIEETVGALRNEITRLENMITEKSKHMQAAASLFKI